MAAADYVAVVQQLYISYFGRPADTFGLKNFTEQLDALDAPTEFAELNSQAQANPNGPLGKLVNSFNASDEAKALYGSDNSELGISKFLVAVFQNVLGRDPEAGPGFDFWFDALASGQLTRANAAMAITEGALSNTTPQGLLDAQTVQNKLAVATNFTEALDTPVKQNAYSTVAAIGIAAGLLQGVTPTTDVEAYQANVEAAVASVVSGSIPTQTFTLTTGADTIVGGNGNDIINAVEAAGPLNTLTVGDSINGGAGTDTLVITQTGNISQPLSTTITGVENIVATTAGSVTLNTSAWTGTTSVNATGVATAALTAAATTNVTGTFSGATAVDGAIAVSGGKDVTLTVTGTTTVAADAAAEIVVSGAAGAVSVTNTLTGADTAVQADVSVTGGTSITVTEKLANAVNTTNTHGAVTVTGGATTTTVTVNQDAAATAGATVVGKVNGAVTIADANATSGTAAGTLATVTLNSYGASTIDSSALATVNLSGTGGTLGISRGALTATPTANTLTLNVNGLSAAAITDAEAAADDGFTKLVVNGTTATSTIADISFADATSIEVTGDKKVTFTANTGIAAVTSITVTNTGGSTFGTALAAGVTFTGGAGNDTITLSNAFTKTMNMGAGDDAVTYAGAAGTGGTVVAGDGRDTIKMTDVQAGAADNDAVFNGTFSGFEVLDITAGAVTGSINLAGINGVNEVVTRGVVAANTLTIDGFTSGGTLTLDAVNAGVVAANVTNAVLTPSDTFNLKLSNATAGSLAFGGVTLAGIETVNISTVDAGTSASAAATVDTLTLTATAATTVIVTGNNGLTLTNTGNAAITKFDASGVVGNSATDTAANLAVTFASANNTASATVTITGGAGNDNLAGGAAKDTIIGGAGGDLITGGLGVDTITVGVGRDAVVFNSIDGTSTDSGTANFDSVNGFKLADAITTAANLSNVANLLGNTSGGADLSVLALNLTDNGAANVVVAAHADATGNGQAVGVTYDVTDGILTLAGTGAASVDTLGEWLAEAAVVAAAAGETVAFEFGTDTYVFAQNGTDDVLVKLVGVTGATGLVEGVAATTAAAGSIVFWSV